LVKVTASNSDENEDVGEPGGQHPGLAGAGAGEHQHRAVDRLDGAALRVIEPSEIRDVRG